MITSSIGAVIDLLDGRELPHLYMVYLGEGLLSPANPGSEPRCGLSPIKAAEVSIDNS